MARARRTVGHAAPRHGRRHAAQANVLTRPGYPPHRSERVPGCGRLEAGGSDAVRRCRS